MNGNTWYLYKVILFQCARVTIYQKTTADKHGLLVNRAWKILLWKHMNSHFQHSASNFELLSTLIAKHKYRSSLHVTKLFSVIGTARLQSSTSGDKCSEGPGFLPTVTASSPAHAQEPFVVVFIFPWAAVPTEEPPAVSVFSVPNGIDKKMMTRV